MTILRVGAQPDAFEGRGLFFDGENARPLKARLQIDEARKALLIFANAADATRNDEEADTPEAIAWPLDQIRRVRDQAGGDMMVLRLKRDPLTRLILTAEEERRIATVRATRMNVAPPVEGKRRLLVWGAAAIGAVAAMIFFLIPFLADNLARFLPPAGQRALGETVFEDIRGALDRTGLNPVEICEGPDGLAALEAMGARLYPAGLGEQELSVFVLDHEMVNAFALPGGIVVLMRGLIDAAENPDEVAAVYAHEVGHVVARDPSRIALRSAGSIGVLGLLLGDFAGGAVVLFLTNRMIEADYTQDAEAAADAYAQQSLLDADVSPAALATFFERLRAQYGDAEGVVQHFLAHPTLGDRIEAAREATPEDASFTPVIDDAQWTALQSICADG